MQRVIYVLMALLLLSSVVLPGHGHAAERPVLFTSPDDIERIKGYIAGGREPWTTAQRRLLSDAHSAVSAGPFHVRKNNGSGAYFTEEPYCGWTRRDGRQPDCRDGQINPQADRKDYEEAIKVGETVRTLGLAYALTGDSRYAKRAVYLIRVWALDSGTRMEPRYTNNQSKIELSITMPGLFYGASLLWDSPDWKRAERDAFKRWSQSFVNSGKAWRGTNNFEIWRLVAVISGSEIAGDRTSFRYAVDRYKRILPEHISRDGVMVKELGRTKSLMYSLYSLNAFTQVAEIAHNNGEDLYRQSRLKQALDYHVPYVVNQDRWTRQQITPIDSRDVAHYEFAYAYYRDNDYKRAIDEWGRPLEERRTAGPVTLTHARSSSNNPQPRPTDPPAPRPEPTATPPQPPRDTDTYTYTMADRSDARSDVQFRDCPSGQSGTCWYRTSYKQWVAWDAVRLSSDDRVRFHVAGWRSGPGATFEVQFKGRAIGRFSVDDTNRFDWYSFSLPSDVSGTGTLRLVLAGGHSVDVRAIQIERR